jgi:acyl-CoA synthetase (NDP forming)
MGKNAKRIIEAALDERRQNLLESEAKAICAEYDMPVPSFEVARNTKGALDAASRLGFPVVLKIVSKDIPHKTEAGGVLLNIQTPLDVEHGFPKLIENAKQYNSEAQIEGVLIQRMAPQGTEVIIGALTDPHFGQTMMFGLGGVFVEILKDVTFRIAPIEEHDGRQMIREINAYPILRGYRGKPPVDEETLVRMILRVSDLIMENPEINQMDLNPVMVYDKGASIVDARIVLRS